MHQRSIRVVAALIEHDGHFLITQRRKEAVLPLLWEFPGGRVEQHETDVEALKRTLAERLDVEIAVGGEMATMVHEYDGYTVTLVILQARLIGEREPRAARVNDFTWARSEDFDQFQFPPADQATMDLLLGFAGRGALSH
jgi:8-oxo-dGTP diphosphatase